MSPDPSEDKSSSRLEGIAAPEPTEDRDALGAAAVGGALARDADDADGFDTVADFFAAIASNFAAGIRNGFWQPGHASFLSACVAEIFSDLPHLHLTRMAMARDSDTFHGGPQLDERR